MQEIFKVEVQITVEDIRSLLVGAFEGGSNYWMDIVKIKYPEGTTKEDFKTGKHAVKGWEDVVYLVPFVEGGEVILEDLEEEGKKYVLNLANIKRGLQLMAESSCKHHFCDILSENTDADTSDVFLQFCVLGELIYG
jgi:hypothetical protein